MIYIFTYVFVNFVAHNKPGYLELFRRVKEHIHERTKSIHQHYHSKRQDMRKYNFMIYSYKKNYVKL